jgi:basic amino acid/polyamine antiporter, APA family
VQLARRLSTIDGLAMVVGIMVGAGIFRTPGLVATQLGRPWLTFVAWIAGGVVSVLGALVFAELATRHPMAGGKYVYAREAFGRRAGFVVGWVETLGIYCAAIAGVGVVAGDYLAQLLGLDGIDPRWLGVGFVALVTALNLIGVTFGSTVQNVVTGAKVAALLLVVGVAAVLGTGAGWSAPSASTAGTALAGAFAVAFQAVIWTYYGYPDAAKIAEEVVDPERTLPRVLLLGIGGATALYVLLNAAFLHVLPFERIAGSTLVAKDVADVLFGARAAAVVAGLALLVVLGSLNGNVFVTPRVVFGLARDGLGPRVFERVNAGGTPWTAMLLVGLVSCVLAASGTFDRLLSWAILSILLTDGFMVLVLFRLRRTGEPAPFRVPFYPLLPLVYLGLYVALFVGAAVEQPILVAIVAAMFAAAWLVAAIWVKGSGPIS